MPSQTPQDGPGHAKAEKAASMLTGGNYASHGQIDHVAPDTEISREDIPSNFKKDSPYWRVLLFEYLP